MTLVHVEFEYESVSLPSEVIAFLQGIDHVVERHRVDAGTNYRGFVPSDYATVYQCLKTVHDSQLLRGERFGEWGSGVSVVAALAAMMGYESFAFEYNSELCVVAEEICEDFDLPVSVVNGSFIPDGMEELVDQAFAAQNGEMALHTDADRAYEEIGYSVSDFDLIFAYPWPNDVDFTHELFDRCASAGAMLLAYYDEQAIALYRKE